jgi:hypothetical protein
MDNLQTTRIVLQLFWSDVTMDKSYLYYLMRLLIAVLHGGNTEIQGTVYSIFISIPESEKFFK